MRIGGLVACILAGVAGAARGQDQVYMTEGEALEETYGSGAEVRFGRGTLELSPGERRRIARKAGSSVPGSHEVIVVEVKGRIAGYAMVWEEIGKYKPITFLVALDEKGKVKDVHVLVYREPIGSDVRKRWWRARLVGKDADDPIQVGRDILRLTGATLSCEAICRGVKKAAAIVQVALVGKERRARKILSKAGAGPEPVVVQDVRLGRLCVIEAFGEDRRKTAGAIEKAFERMERVEKVISGGEGSELAEFNASAGEWVRVSPELARFLEFARGQAEKTGGLFDPTIGAVTELWGFRTHRFRVPGEGPLRRALERVGYTRLKVEGGGKAWMKRGTRIDPRFVAGGYLADEAIAALREAGVKSARVRLGGVVYALGAPPGKAGWSVEVRNPFDASDRAFRVVLKDGAMATTSRTEDFFEEGGRTYHSVLSPKTGRPVEGIASVTVLAERCAGAQSLATALFVGGIDRGRAEGFGVEAAWIPVDEKLRVVATEGFEARMEK